MAHAPALHTPTEYWNHNAAYHPWLVRAVSAHRGDVLDVGCGEGLLLQHLATVSRSVTGLDVDGPWLARARQRVLGIPHAAVVASDFLAYDAGDCRFDAITFVASIHHMDLQKALVKASDLLRPGGELLVVGLSANKTRWDWTLGAFQVPLARWGSKRHHEYDDPGVPTAGAQESLKEIRGLARQVCPGVHIRRALYYRYLLRWTKPGAAGQGVDLGEAS